MTPELRPDWCRPGPASLSSTVTLAAGTELWIARAVASPTMPAPTTTTSTRSMSRTCSHAEPVPLHPWDIRAAGAYADRMARIDVPEGPGGEAAMIWTMRPEMAGMVDRMITTAYQRSNLPAAEREVARMRVAQMNDCSACATFRAPSVIEAGVTEDIYEHLDEWRTWPGYTDRQRLAIEYAERFATDH